MEARATESCAQVTEALVAYGLSADVAAEIEAHLIPVTFEKGAVVFLRGTSADLVFWVLKGLVKLYLPTGESSRTLVDLARPGDLIGFVNEVASRGRYQVLEAQALTKCSIGLLSREHMARLLSKLDHETVVRLLEHFNTAWSRLFVRYVAFIGSSFRERLEQVLYGLGERFGATDKRGILLVPELSHEDLAEMIGSSRPMVSKLIADMCTEGLLERSEKRRFILRPKPALPAASRPELNVRAGSNGNAQEANKHLATLAAASGTATAAHRPLPPRNGVRNVASRSAL
ncbi:MAG TPA: Crp/Fnr family transcriptional regulator [Candidatus Binataceae bacterium]|nr:Crp/Fnr family transcriptional regulator [Candidatus Binataceae bacterium]